uniref:CPG4 domain-containing protein n=1 Tax=Rhabditophanes sp. KR3021 TaxID=114890 RepID=A0AC35TIK1_9BILA
MHLCTVLIAVLFASIQGAVDIAFNGNHFSNVIGAPPCVKKCVAPFIDNNILILYATNVSKMASQICSAYKSFEKCYESTPGCDLYVEAYKMIFEDEKNYCQSPINTTCVDAALPDVLKQCDTSSSLANKITELFNKRIVKNMAQSTGNIITFIENSGDVCGAVRNFFPCLKKQLNSKCRGKGNELARMLIGPFYRSINKIKNSPTLKTILMPKLLKLSLNQLQYLMQKKKPELKEEPSQEVKEETNAENKEEAKPSTENKIGTEIQPDTRDKTKPEQKETSKK